MQTPSLYLLPSPGPGIRSLTEPHEQQSVRPRSLIFPVVKKELSEDKPAASLYCAPSSAEEELRDRSDYISSSFLYFS